MPTTAQLYIAHRDDLLRFFNAKGLTPETAEDLTQDVFVVCHRRLAEYDHSRSAARTWLHGIATNVLRNHWRKTKTRDESKVERPWVDRLALGEIACLSDAPPVDGDQWDPEDLTRWMEYLRRLSPRERVAVFVDDDPALKDDRYAGRQKLRRMLREDGVSV